MTPDQVALVSAAVRGAVQERKRRVKRSPSETRAARKSRGKAQGEYTLPAEVIEAVRLRAERTGRSRSAVVEEALRAFLEVGR